MTSPLQLVPRPGDRPAHLIRIAVPRLNKVDTIDQCLSQLETRDYDLDWAEVTETVGLSCNAWNEFMGNLLEDRDWLAGKGGCNSWAFTDEDDDRDYFKLSSAEQKLWKDTAYLLVVAVVAPTGQTIYIDPQGFNYARYVAFSAAGLPEGKTREELRREAVKAEQLEKLKELAERIANPPAVPVDHGLRFLWNGIKHNGGNLHKCSYSQGTLNKPYPDGTITVYSRDYRRFTKEIAGHFHVENNTDSESDYFDDDKFRVCPNHPLYPLVKAAYDAQEAHHARRMLKRGLTVG